MRSQEEILQMKLEARDLEIVALKDALFMRNQMIQNLDKEAMERRADLEDLEKENEDLDSQVDDLQSDLHLTEAQLRSKKIDIELLKDRVSVLQKEIERECKNFGEFIGHNFSTTNHAERWECDNTHELYDIEELYNKYVQHTQAGRV
jgi:chromosome segregation ATPase